MIQIDLWGMLCIMGIPTAATGLFVWLLQRWISKEVSNADGTTVIIGGVTNNGL